MSPNAPCKVVVSSTCEEASQSSAGCSHPCCTTSEVALYAPRLVPSTDFEDFSYYLPREYVHKRVTGVVGYRSSRTIHPLVANLDDPHYSEGEWLVRWADPSEEDGDACGERPPWNQCTWEGHAFCMEHIARAVQRFIASATHCRKQRAKRLVMGYALDIEDVDVGAIVAQSDTHYWAEIDGLSDEFLSWEFRTQAEKRFLRTYFNNNINPHICVPKQQLKSACPKKVKAWESTDASERDLPVPMLHADYAFVLIAED